MSETQRAQEILYKDESYQIIGACFEVYKEMGCGFAEPVYQECLQLELRNRNIPHWEQRELELRYKDEILKQTYKPDFVCYEKIILEIKAVSTLTNQHRAQVHNYLKVTNYRLGILVNFSHHPEVEWERIVH